MNSPYHQFVTQLSEEELHTLFTNKMMICVNDESFYLSSKGVAHAYKGIRSGLRRYLYDNESRILRTLHKSHPLCKDEFIFQAKKIFCRDGASNFCQHQNNTKHLALMIDDNCLISISDDDPRNQYGYFYSHHSAINNQEAEDLVKHWLDSGSAYEDYRVKTHCRYICT